MNKMSEYVDIKPIIEAVFSEILEIYMFEMITEETTKKIEEELLTGLSAFMPVTEVCLNLYDGTLNIFGDNFSYTENIFFNQQKGLTLNNFFGNL